MNILFVTPAVRAGSQQYTHQLANALVARGHRVAVATGVDYEMKPYPRQYHGMELFDRFRPRPLLIFRFLRVVRSFRPDIVHFVGAQHPSAYLMLCGVLRMLTRAPFIFTPQDVFPNTDWLIDKLALPPLYRRMRHVFLNAEQNRQEVMTAFGVNSEMLTVVPIPDHMAFIRDSVEPQFPDVADDRKLVLCFGLIEPRKGIHTLIQAFPNIHAKVPEALLYIVGKPYVDVAPYLREIEQQGIGGVTELIPRYVSFEEMAGLLSRADVMVLPYDSGWNSGVLASAFGFHKLVVATKVGGFEEVVQDGETGLLVPPRQPDQLADAVVRILTDHQLRERVKKGIRRVAQVHSWEQLAQTSEATYDRIVSGRRQPPV